jgi:hypothetical protein
MHLLIHLPQLVAERNIKLNIEDRKPPNRIMLLCATTVMELETFLTTVELKAAESGKWAGTCQVRVAVSGPNSRRSLYR